MAHSNHSADNGQGSPHLEPMSLITKRGIVLGLIHGFGAAALLAWGGVIKNC
jgi:hypothetical protein